MESNNSTTKPNVMKNLILAAAFAGLALISCQNTPMNTVEAGSAPMVCPATGGECSEDMEACAAEAKCDMGAATCDMADKAATCEMGEMAAKKECCTEEKN